MHDGWQQNNWMQSEGSVIGLCSPFFRHLALSSHHQPPPHRPLTALHNNSKRLEELKEDLSKATSLHAMYKITLAAQHVAKQAAAAISQRQVRADREV